MQGEPLTWLFSRSDFSLSLTEVAASVWLASSFRRHVKHTTRGNCSVSYVKYSII